MWKAVAVAALCWCVQSGCSPYVFSENVQTFSSKMEAIDNSYKDNQHKIIAEQRLSDRIEWMRDRPVLAPGPGCRADAPKSMRCELIRQSAGTPAVRAADPAGEPGRPKPPEMDVCEPAAAANPEPKIEEVKTSSSLTPEELLKILDDYIAALAAVTRAQDRADFDNAAAKVSASVEALAQSVPAYGAAAGPVAKASSNALLWLVGQDLDYRRLRELQAATAAACKSFRVLAEALGAILEGQRKVRLRGLHDVLTLRIEAANIAGTTHATDQAYGEAVDDAQAAAEAFQTVRATDPKAAAQALARTHGALVLAVRDNDRQLTALITSLQTFVRQADVLANAAAANSNPSAKKS